MKGGKQPTATQRRWHQWLAETGCYACQSPASIHHCVGSTGRHRKIHIGQDWVVPLCYDHHQGLGGIHGDLSLFDGQGLGETRKEIEKAIFSRLVAHYWRLHHKLPCPADVIEAVESYHK